MSERGSRKMNRKQVVIHVIQVELLFYDYKVYEFILCTCFVFGALKKGELISNLGV